MNEVPRGTIRIIVGGEGTIDVTDDVTPAELAAAAKCVAGIDYEPVNNSGNSHSIFKRSPLLYLDCYYEGVGLPYISYGPASELDVLELQGWLGKYFDRTDIVNTTKGYSPISRENWPSVS